MTTNNDDTNVANNVAQGNSQHLTEQWKKGALKEGWYYINDSQIDYKYSKHSSVDFFITPHEDIKEVLAPVPSYEEWQQLIKFLEEFNALEVAKENQQLKKLLLVCREMLAEYRFSEGDFTIGDIDTSLLLNMIDHTIGEKK